MHQPDNKPETLTSVPTDLEAAMIVSTLAAYDVDATTSGSFTAGSRADATGEVMVLVRRCDLDRAREALAGLESDQPSETSEQPAPTAALLGVESPVKKFLTLALMLLLAIVLLQSCL